MKDLDGAIEHLSKKAKTMTDRIDLSDPSSIHLDYIDAFDIEIRYWCLVFFILSRSLISSTDGGGKRTLRLNG